MLDLRHAVNVLVNSRVAAVEISVHACSAACSACYSWESSLALLRAFESLAVSSNALFGSSWPPPPGRQSSFIQPDSCFQLTVAPFARTRIAYNAVMTASETRSHWNGVLQLLQDMGVMGMAADSTTFNMLSSSCGDIGSRTGVMFHDSMMLFHQPSRTRSRTRCSRIVFLPLPSSKLWTL